MHTTSFPSLRCRASLAGAAFTLIELLVVISIIAVLAGLLLPVVSKVMENARKVSAKTTETQIVTAVNSYMTEYGQYPTLPPADPTYDTTFPDANFSNYPLFEVLRSFPNLATDSAALQALNSRRVTYFEGKNVKNATQPKDGFILTANSAKAAYSQKPLNPGDFVDPWGNLYFCRIDTNYSNALLNPYKDKSTPGSTSAGSDTTGTSGTIATDQLRTGVVAYSYGTDGQIGTNGAGATSPYTALGDDVVSWQ